MVCTSRLIVSNHRPVEVYAGLAIGMVSMFLGPLFDFFF
jgi:hypothetical protein